MSKRNNTIRRNELEDGSAVYLLELSADTEAVLSRSAKHHGCRPEAVLAQAIILYVSDHDEVLALSLARSTSSADGPIN